MFICENDLELSEWGVDFKGPVILTLVLTYSLERNYFPCHSELSFMSTTVFFFAKLSPLRYLKTQKYREIIGCVSFSQSSHTDNQKG